MHLIEKNKIDIYDIPVAALTEQYIEYLNLFKEFNIEVASEFIVMAATLLQIKSRLMLPKPLKEKPEEEEEDPRRELVERILEYRKFKKISLVLNSMAEEQERFFSREPAKLPVHQLPPEHLSLDVLFEAFRTAVEVREELSIPEEIVAREEYSIQDKMEEILILLQQSAGKISFSRLFHMGTKTEFIALFLALLELIRMKTVYARQADLFAEIYICLR